MSSQVAVIDRRVRVAKDARSAWESECRISDLRAEPYVVLLGEPGIGKSTVLRQEAEHENTRTFTVRDLVTGSKIDSGKPLFIDALDEYRIGGDSIDKVHSLAKLVQDAQPSRWRLTCRAEDWRKDSDLSALQGVTGQRPIVVAQLLPLSSEESIRVLESLGERDPQPFVAKANSLGAQAFLESPLSLKLLHAAVRGGSAWPSNRYDLFSTAVLRLAHEHNPIHKGGERNPVPKIIDAAERTCLVMLISGARALWRSHDEPPAAADNRAYLRSYEIQIDESLFFDMLDTTLFRGEGEVFEPMHRVVAEFLAGRALATAVMGKPNAAAFPISRALAMVTGGDRKPPAELRGVFAWLAACLAKVGREEDATRLIESDAVTVLAYGDAAAFSSKLRKAIFERLDRDDPYFLSAHHDHDSAIGALAGPDLADEFAEVLTRGSDGTHRLATVFEILSSGTPVETLRPILWNICLDSARPGWQRQRAANAWLHGFENRARELYDAVGKTPASADREDLRLNIASHLPAESLSVQDIKTLIADFAKAPSGHTVGRLIGLSFTLASVPRGALFDEKLDTWLSKEALQSHSVELEGFIDEMLASAIKAMPPPTAEQIWRWACNSRDGHWTDLHEKSRRALAEWLDADPNREAVLFDVIVQDEFSDADGAPWIPANKFITLTGRGIGANLVRHLLTVAISLQADPAGKSWLAVAANIASRLNDASVSDEVLSAASARADCQDLVEKLTNAKSPRLDDEQDEYKKAREEKHKNTKAKNIEALSADIESIKAGTAIGHLNWAATHYFAKGDKEQASAEQIAHFSNDELAKMLLEGCRAATKKFSDVDAKMLGSAIGKNETYHLERIALAGVYQWATERFELAEQPPMVVAIAVLKASWMLRSAERRTPVERWAFKRLAAEPSVGAAMLLDCWVEAVDAGANHIESFGLLNKDETKSAVVTEALHSLLAARRSMPPELLRSALRAAAKHIEPAQLLKLAESALKDPNVDGEQRKIWSFLAFELDPSTNGRRILSDYSANAAVELYEQFRTYEREPKETIEPAHRALREALIVQLVGPAQGPIEDDQGWRDGTSSKAEITRRAIQLISRYPEAEAGRQIRSLIAIPALSAWNRELRHAYAEWARLVRESTFRYATPDSIVNVLAGGPPLNAADTLAVVLEELHRLRRELRTSDNTPWKRYWNTDKHGKVVNPRIENECRDHLLDRLRDRLERYQVAATLPEVRRPEESRTDMLVLTRAGKSLPIEIKRHFHPDLWVAPSTQLRQYREAEGSDGYGIYLVFWFGLDRGKLPARPDGNLPTSAEDLERRLVADLCSRDREQVSVIVFDVSAARRPDLLTAKNTKKR